MIKQTQYPHRPFRPSTYWGGSNSSNGHQHRMDFKQLRKQHFLDAMMVLLTLLLLPLAAAGIRRLMVCK